MPRAIPLSLGEIWRTLHGHATGALPIPPEQDHSRRFLYGLAQPVLAGRLLLHDRALARAALIPAFWLAAFCAAAALLREEGSYLKTFYNTFALLAPVPSIVFGNHYARLAAEAHQRLGLGSCQVRRQSIPARCIEALKGAAVAAVAVAPFLAALAFLPLLGKILTGVIASGWALHWIVVEAFDSARICRDGHDPQAEDPGPAPWFVRPVLHLGAVAPFGVGWLARRFARLSAWLARPWNEEIAVLEAHPILTLGFALTTAALLATPVLNLLFRPIIIVASVHLLGQVRVPAQVAKVADVTPAAMNPNISPSVPAESSR